jgi:two-component system, NarL family, sensor histidine kinase DevS
VDTLDEPRLRRLIEVGRSLVSELDLETVLRRVLEVARELTGARYAALGILDGEKTELERFITAGIDEETHRRIGDLPRGRGVLGQLIRDPTPLRLADVGSHPQSYGFPPGHPVMRTFLGVPVVVRGEAFGNLYLTEKNDGGEFTEQDEHAAVILSDWAAIAIENARLYQHAEAGRLSLERAVRSLEVTASIARAIGGETELDRVLELIVKRGRALVEARWLWILVREGDEFIVAATAGEVGDEIQGRRMPVEGSVAGEAMKTGRPERVGEVAGRGVVLPASVGMEASTALIVPLVFRGQALGILMAFDRTEGGPEFTRVDEELMLSFAASAATAVHTARSVAQERLEHSLEASEQERSRWARELHDETLQALGGLQLMLSSAQREPDADKRGDLIRNAAEQITAEIRKLRNLITELRPAELDEIGLESALEALADRRGAEDAIEVSLDVDLGAASGERERRLPPQIESTVYRVVQEALTNVAKHAAAERVEVRIGLVNGVVDVVVADDGEGFDPGAASAGWGLLGMKERVALLSGSLELESQPGRGTTVHAVLPTRVAPAAGETGTGTPR